LLIKVLAHPVNDLGELARNDRVFGYPAGQDVGGGVEEPPRRAVAPVEGGVFPLAEVRACASRSAVSGSTSSPTLYRQLSIDILALLGISAVGATGGKLTQVAKRRLSFANWAWLRRNQWLPTKADDFSPRARWSELVTDYDGKEFDVYSLIPSATNFAMRQRSDGVVSLFDPVAAAA
jgi:hypothetical protein